MPLTRFGFVVPALVLVAAACGGGDSKSTDITVEFTLYQHQLGAEGTRCAGKSGYDDIHETTVVVVKNEANTIIGSNQLGQGRIGKASYCDYRTVVEGLPRAKFYSVEVSHRGPLTYSFEEMQSKNWMVQVKLGD